MSRGLKKEIQRASRHESRPDAFYRRDGSLLLEGLTSFSSPEGCTDEGIPDEIDLPRLMNYTKLI